MWLHFSGGLPSQRGVARGNAAVSAAVLRASRPQKALATATRFSAEHLNGGQDAPQTAGKMPAVRPAMARLPLLPLIRSRTRDSGRIQGVRLHYSGIELLRPFTAWMIRLDQVPLGVALWPCQPDTALPRTTHFDPGPNFARACELAGLRF